MNSIVSNKSILGSNEEILLNYTKIHKILMDYLKKKQNEESIITWTSKIGHKMKATLRKTNLNENLQKYYSNDNILKLPISNTFDETEGIKIPTLTRISIFSKDLKIDGVQVIDKYYHYYIKKIEPNNNKLYNEKSYIKKNYIDKNYKLYNNKINKLPTLNGIYIKIHETLMNYLKQKKIPVKITWTSKNGHKMTAILRETNLNENLQKNYSNDNILKLPISNTFDETDEIEIPTLTRISIFSKDLKIDVKSVFNFMKNNEENLYS